MARDKQLDPVKAVRRFVQRLKDGDRVYVGIDSGSTGAIAFVSRNACAAIDIPTVKVKRGKGKKAKNKSVPDYQAIIAVFKRLGVESHLVHVCLEEAQVGIPGKGNSAYNGFRVGCNWGCWPLFLLSKGYSLEVVRPSEWKKKMGLQGKDKESSRHKAMQMFPTAPLSRKKDHDRAEALLLSEYLRRVHKGKV